jgi:hypothetical protein
MQIPHGSMFSAALACHFDAQSCTAVVLEGVECQRLWESVLLIEAYPACIAYSSGGRMFILRLLLRSQ